MLTQLIRHRDFDIEGSWNCVYDYLEIRDGDTSNSTVLGRYCTVLYCTVSYCTVLYCAGTVGTCPPCPTPSSPPTTTSTSPS